MDSDPPTYSNGGKLSPDRRGTRHKKRFDSWRKRRECRGPWSSCHKEPGRRGTCQGVRSPSLNSGEWQPFRISFPHRSFCDTLPTQTNLHWCPQTHGEGHALKGEGCGCSNLSEARHGHMVWGGREDRPDRTASKCLDLVQDKAIPWLVPEVACFPAQSGYKLLTTLGMAERRGGQL